jgi:transposase
MRIIGLDIHRAFAEAVAWQDGKLIRIGRIDMRRDRLQAFVATLPKDDVVVIEATGNAAAVVAVISPHEKRVIIANPKQVRVIAHAKIKTDTTDAGALAQLYASGFLPEVWIGDEATQALRRQVTRRNQIVRQRSRLKNIIQSILHAHLVSSCPIRIYAVPRGGPGYPTRSCRTMSAMRSSGICGNSTDWGKISGSSSGTSRAPLWLTRASRA